MDSSQTISPPGLQYTLMISEILFAPSVKFGTQMECMTAYNNAGSNFKCDI